jgi:hypothetical protein
MQLYITALLFVTLPFLIPILFFVFSHKAKKGTVAKKSLLTIGLVVLAITIFFVYKIANFKIA